MSYSSLLGSFVQKAIHEDSTDKGSSTQLRRKRRKLQDTKSTDSDTVPSVSKVDQILTETPINLNQTTLTSVSTDSLKASYNSHFNKDDRTPPSWNSSTHSHPVLGRIVVSHDRLIPERMLQDSPFPAPETKLHPDPSSRQQASSFDGTTLLSQYLSTYADLVYTNLSATRRNNLRTLFASHFLNHVLMTRRLVLKNNEKAVKEANGEGSTTERRDQGFTRPKVLLLLPTRNACYEVTNLIIRLAGREAVENKSRFENEFGPGPENKPFSNKPEDFKILFHGNSDDMFRVGLKLTRNTIKLFSGFYDSDIILASPLGLKTAIGSNEKTVGDFDFLSSIEIVYLDSVDALLMQNWDHVESIFSSLNQMPNDSHGCDFSRVRNWYLNGNASAYRQTIVSAAFLSPEVNSLLSKHGKNYSGIVKVQDIGVSQLSHHLSQLFSRIPCEKLISDPDVRFDYFIKSILPLWKRNKTIEKGGILVFLSSYLDFIRLRNYLSKAGESFGEISEYSNPSSATRSRAHFLSGRYKILLYTERAHHFRRYQIKGVSNILIYNLPANPTFYADMVGLLRMSVADGRTTFDEARVQALFTKWDALKIERIVGDVGSEDMKRIGSVEGDVVDFEFP